MTVSNETAYAERTWTGVETSFNPNMQANALADVVLAYRKADNSIIALNSTHLTLSIDSGKFVTAVPAAMPAAPGTVIFSRNTPALQGTSFVNLGSYTPQVHETLHDAAAMRDAEIRHFVGLSDFAEAVEIAAAAVIAEIEAAGATTLDNVEAAVLSALQASLFATDANTAAIAAQGALDNMRMMVAGLVGNAATHARQAKKQAAAAAASAATLSSDQIALTAQVFG